MFLGAELLINPMQLRKYLGNPSGWAGVKSNWPLEYYAMDGHQEL